MSNADAATMATSRTRTTCRLLKKPSSGGALAEVGGAGESPVEAGPGLARGELALEAIEAAEAPAEAVDHVDENGLAGGGHHRRSVFERAVVGEDDVQNRLGEGWVEAGNVLDLTAHLV